MGVKHRHVSPREIERIRDLHRKRREQGRRPPMPRPSVMADKRQQLFLDAVLLDAEFDDAEFDARYIKNGAPF